MKHAYLRGNVVWVKGSVDGKRYRVSTNKRADKYTLAWAEKHWAEIINNAILSKQKNEIKGAKEVKLSEFATAWLNSYRGNVRELTHKAYVADTHKRILSVFGDKRLSEITHLDLTRWQGDLKTTLSAKRINNLRNLFSQILDAGVDMELINKNPFVSVKKLKNEKTQIAPLSLDEVKLVISAADRHFANVLKVAFFTGMRTGELIALRWDKIDFERETIRIDAAIRQGLYGVPKTQSSVRTIKMLPIVKEALLELYNDSEWVIPNSQGGMLYEPKTLSQKWTALLKKVGLEHRVFYQTRHTFASIMLNKNEDVLWVSSTMGHADASITFKRYAKTLDSDKQRAKFLNEIEL
ncbi:site-specific integrase [Campylobacter sp. 7477a]|nr:site-specific integrase [Campylobacter sp. 7477a]